MSNRPIKLFWSRGYGKHSDYRQNFGDWMSPLICEVLSRKRIVYASPLQCDLFAIGSILNRSNRTHRLHRLGFSRSIDIWGSGSLKESHRFIQKHRYHCVRGKLTHERITSGPENPVYGDPGLLCQELLPANQGGKKKSIGFVPHEEEKNHPFVVSLLERIIGATLIDVHLPVCSVIEQINECEMVLSSSLHGLIVADALGIPNGWIKLSDQLPGGSYKFHDYYSCFGITNPAPVKLTLASNLNSIGDALADYRREGIEQVKQRLRSSFPYY